MFTVHSMGEIHATTPIPEPNRHEPKRHALVFFRHRNLHYPEHGGPERRRKKLEGAKKTACKEGMPVLVPEDSIDMPDLVRITPHELNYLHDSTKVNLRTDHLQLVLSEASGDGQVRPNRLVADCKNTRVASRERILINLQHLQHLQYITFRFIWILLSPACTHVSLSPSCDECAYFQEVADAARELCCSNGMVIVLLPWWESSQQQENIKSLSSDVCLPCAPCKVENLNCVMTQRPMLEYHYDVEEYIVSISDFAKQRNSSRQFLKRPQSCPS